MLPNAFASFKSVVVLAPHPDDETIGCFALITQLRRRGVSVRVIVVTNGAASHRSSNRFPKARLIKMRQRETERVMQLAGVSKSHITFLNLPDGGMGDLTRKHMQHLRRHFQKHFSVDAVFGPSAAEAHPDHCAVYRYWKRAFKARPRYFAYMVWPQFPLAKRGRAPTITVRIARLQKRKAIEMYRSQTGAITDDPDGFSINRFDLYRFSNPAEGFRQE